MPAIGKEQGGNQFPKSLSALPRVRRGSSTPPSARRSPEPVSAGRACTLRPAGNRETSGQALGRGQRPAPNFIRHSGGVRDPRPTSSTLNREVIPSLFLSVRSIALGIGAISLTLLGDDRLMTTVVRPWFERGISDLARQCDPRGRSGSRPRLEDVRPVRTTHSRAWSLVSLGRLSFFSGHKGLMTND
jgi:hypothetical protein